MKKFKRILAVILICGMVVNNAAYVQAGETEEETVADDRLTAGTDGEDRAEPESQPQQEQTVEETPEPEQAPESGGTAEETPTEESAADQAEASQRADVDWTMNQEALQLAWENVTFRQKGQEPAIINNENNCLDLSVVNPDTLETLQFSAGFTFWQDNIEGGLRAGDTFCYVLPREAVLLEEHVQPVDVYLCDEDGAVYEGGQKFASYVVAGNTVTVTVTADEELIPKGNLQGAIQLEARLNTDNLGTEKTTVKAVLQNDRTTELVLPAKAPEGEAKTGPAALDEESAAEEAKAGEVWGEYRYETIEKEWIDNNAAGRPNLLDDNLLNVAYSLDGGSVWKLWTKGALGIDRAMAEWIEGGIASVAENGVGYETYRMNLPHTDGQKEICYKFSEKEAEVRGAGYLSFGKGSEFQNIISTSQTFRIVMNTGAVSKSVGDFIGGMKLSGKNGDGSVFEKSLADLGADVAIDDGTGEVTVHNLPRFTVEHEEIIWSLTMADCSAQPDTDDENDRYEVTYDNAVSSNFGLVTDKCHEKGSLIITLTGKTNYQATKHWLDEGKEQRPKAALYLWRYSQREGANYTTASMVKNPNPKKAENIWWTLDPSKDVEIIKTIEADIAPEGLDKYDPEGYRYVYFTREELHGTGYTQQFGIYDPEDGEIKEEAGMLPEGMEKRMPGDTSVYNNGHISNLRTGTVEAAVTKQWEAASFQSQLEDVAVTFCLQQRAKDGQNSDWEETGQTAVMDDFFAEKLIQTVTANVPKYDHKGWELEYRWVECNVQQGTFDTKFTAREDGTSTFVLKQQDAGGVEQEVEYQSLPGDDGIITNRIADKTDYTVEKIWNDDEDHGKDKITIILYRDNKKYAQYILGADKKETALVEETKEAAADEVTGETTSPWAMEFANLPKYDETGHKYTYYAEEETVAGYHASYEYDIENRRAEITNTPGIGGNIIRVRKDWIDDGDDTHRAPIKVKVYNKNDSQQVYADNVWLTEAHYWWQEVAVPQGVTLEDCAMEELSTCDSGIDGPSQIPEGQIRVDGGFADTRHHMYQVQYGVDKERQMLTVTNRRIGLIDITVRKYWVDDDNKKGDRPQDAELKLSCKEYPDAVSDSTVNGTVTVGNAKNWPIQDKDGNPTGSRQSIRTSTDADSAYSEYYFYNLPKYDETGKVVHYSVEEIKGNQNEYSVNIQDTAYQVGGQHTSDKQEIQIANKKSAVKPVKFYKLWKDQYSFERGTRPDIYLELYKTVINNEGTEEIQAVDTYIDRKWTRDTEKEDYLWICDFGELPKYDEHGREIFYYAREQSKVNAQTFDYVTDNDAVYDTAGIYTGQYGNAGAVNIVGTASDASQVLKEEGTFVNRVEKDIIISGKKIWKNVPGGFPDADFPELTIHVDQMGTEIAETATLTRIPGTNNFTFEVSLDKNKEPIPKYDDDGALYSYEVRETVDDTEHLNTVYEKLPGEVNNYIITNTYEVSDAKNTGRLKVEKKWSGIGDVSKYQYPAADFKLYRQYASKDGTKNTEMITVGGREVQVTAPELVDTKRLHSGTADSGNLEFDSAKLRIYAPNGSLYYYYVEETVLNGYDTENGIQPSQRSEFFGLDGGMDEHSVTFENTYKDPQEQVQITGSKVWNDYSNAFQTRPAAEEFTKALKLERYTDAQEGAGGAPAIESQTITLQTENPSAPYYFTWTETGDDRWNYSISNLDRYAPSSMPWKYRITEAVPQGYKNAENKVDSAKGLTDENGNLTMPALKNTNSKTAELTKIWEGGNSYGQRPSSVTLELWMKIGTGTWQSAQEGLEAYTVPETVKEQYTYTLTEQNKSSNIWKHTFTNLPAYVKQDGKNVECQYQVVETKAGEYVMDQANDKFGVTDSGVTYPAGGPYAPAGTYAKDKTTITNKLSPEGTGYIKISKFWKDSGNIYDTRPMPDTAENTWKTDYVLYRKAGETGAWEQVKSSDNKYIILRVAGAYGEDAKERRYGPFQKEDAQGNLYIYAAMELLPDGYTKTESIVPETGSLPDMGAAVTDMTEIHTGEALAADILSTTETENKLNPTVSIEAEKSWEKADGTPYTALDGKEITLELKKKTEKGTESFRHPLTVTLDGTPDTGASGNRETQAWKALFEGAPQYAYGADKTPEALEYTVEEVETGGEGTRPSVTAGFWNTVGPTVTGDNGAQAVTVTNRQTEFLLNKTDTDGRTIDRGVTLGIYKGSVTPEGKVAEWKRTVEDGVVKESVAGLNGSSVEHVDKQTAPARITGLEQGSYILHEEEAPHGYERAEDMEFVLGKDGKLTGGTGISSDGLTLSMADTAISLKLRKQNTDAEDIAEESLGYAEFNVEGKFADHSIQKSGVTSDNISSLDGLWIAGEAYTFTETKAPAGYIRYGGSVELVFRTDGTVKTVTGSAGAADPEDSETVIIRNTPVSISVKKTSMNDILLDGAEFALTDKGTDGNGTDAVFDGEKIVVTGADGTAALTENGASMVSYGHFYQLEETKAPAGYLLPDSNPAVTFEVLDSGKVSFVETDMVLGDKQTEILFKNRPIGLELNKKDGVSKEMLGGAEFEIIRDDGQSRTVTAADCGTVRLINTEEDCFLIQGRSYTVMERKAPQGYKLPEEAVAAFTVNDNGTVQTEEGQLAALIIENERETGCIRIQKVDGEDGNPLSGAEFKVFKKSEMNSPVRTIVTDDKGQAVFEGLEWDTYILKETKAPEGYILDDVLGSAGMEFTIKADSLSPILTSAGAEEGKIENVRNSFTLKKVDENEQALSGAVFTLKDVTDGTDISAMLKGMKDSITLSGILVGGHIYELQETAAPEGYKKAVSPVRFTMGMDGRVSGEEGFEESGYAVSRDRTGITLTDRPTVFALQKTAQDTKKAQKGVRFEITPEGESHFAGGSAAPIVVETDGTGLALLEGRLVCGMSYHVKETLALAGYAYTEDFTVTVDEEGMVRTGDSLLSKEKPYVVEDSPIQIRIQKTDDSVVPKPICGIKFMLKEEGKDEKISLVSDELGILQREDEAAALGMSLHAGRRYIMTEIVEDGSPYLALTGPVRFKVEKNGTLTLGSGDIDGELLRLSEDKKTLTVRNRRTILQVQKKDGEGTALAGAALGIYTEAGGKPDKVVQKDGERLTWISEKEAWKIDGLPTGTYWLKETGAPEGYLTAEPIRFHIDSKGSVALLNGEGVVNGITITMTDEPVTGHVKLIKSSTELGRGEKEPVAGAEFDLYRQKEKKPSEKDILVAEGIATDVEGTWTSEDSDIMRTDEPSKRLGDGLLAGVYYFKETYAPDGYQLDEDTAHVFEIKGAGDDIIVQPGVAETMVENEPYSRTLTLTKQDEVDGRMLSGAVFSLTRVKDAAGNPVSENAAELTTGEDGKATFTICKKGTYRLKETVAPEGYKLAGDRETVVTDESPQQIVLETGKSENVITDERKPGTVTLLKKDGADKTALTGVQFTLYRKNTEGGIFDKLWDFITGSQYRSVDSQSWTAQAIADGKLVIGNLEWGEYYLKETKALEGYVPSDKEFHFVIGRYNSEIILEVDKGMIENTQTDITFTKVGRYNEACSDIRFEGAPDANAQKLLEGVEFTAYSDRSCEKAEQTTYSDGQGSVTFKKLPIGTHYIKETKAPDGYRQDETIYRAELDENGQFTGLIPEDGTEAADYTIVNDVYRTDITFTKVDENDSSRVIAGSTYGLYKRAGDIRREAAQADRLVKIAEAVTDTDGILTFQGVLMDTEYVIKELRAPDGSYVSENPLKLKFTVMEDGQITIDVIDTGDGTAEIDAGTGTIVWKEPQVDVRITKTDEQGRLLGGAALHIEDEEGNTLESWVSVAGEVYQSYGVLASGRKYKLVETKAPDGYLTAEPVEFEVEAKPVAAGQNKVIEVNMVDRAIQKKHGGASSNAAKTGDPAAATAYILWLVTAMAVLVICYRRKNKI